MAATTISIIYLYLDKYSTVGLGTGGNPVTLNIPKEKFTPPVPKVILIYYRLLLFLKDLFKSRNSEDSMIEEIYLLKSTTLESEIKLSGKSHVKN
jgi:hypothetical protein